MSVVWFVIGGTLGAAAGWAACGFYQRRQERLRARFLSFVAHEINTPVSALSMTILNFVQGVFGPVAKEHMPWLVLMREQTARLAALVGDLRDFIHSEFHRDLRLKRQKVAAAAVVSACLDTMRESLHRTGAAVEVRLPAGLPEISADQERLGRVFSAILNHAKKFRTEGPIVLSSEVSPLGVAVTVEYAGMPAPREQIEQALDLYYPVNNPHSQVLASVGLGLGLPCRVVRAHGGEMTLNVDEKGRCRIVVRLPQYEEVARGGEHGQA